jgi:large-conductance mechanosensitive channel
MDNNTKDFFLLKGFKNFLNEKNILISAFSIVIGNLISNIIKKLIDEIISPLSKGDLNKVKENFSLSEYVSIILSFLITTYFLFRIINIIEKLNKK